MASVLNPALAFVAGALTILSPCVLPLVPIVLGSAAQRHRAGPLVLATGLVGSFTIVGLALAISGAQAGFDPELVRQVGAVLMVAAGLVLLAPALQTLVSRAAAPLAVWAQNRQSGLDRFGLAGQGLIGVLLGLVWSPCIGPTLGAAVVLAAQGESLGAVALTMLAFACGIALVLLILAFATRQLLARWRGSLMTGGAQGRRVFGALLVAVGLLVLTGFDHIIEGLIITVSPDWLTDLTTRF
jgi:cytochrome c biogenesis protein CcdA